MADAPDSKSGAHWVCGFKSRPRHHIRIQRLLSKTKKPFVLGAISSLLFPLVPKNSFEIHTPLTVSMTLSMTVAMAVFCCCKAPNAPRLLRPASPPPCDDVMMRWQWANVILPAPSMCHSFVCPFLQKAQSARKHC